METPQHTPQGPERSPSPVHPPAPYWLPHGDQRHLDATTRSPGRSAQWPRGMGKEMLDPATASPTPLLDTLAAGRIPTEAEVDAALATHAHAQRGGPVNDIDDSSMAEPDEGVSAQDQLRAIDAAQREKDAALLSRDDTWAAQAWINLHLIANGQPLDEGRNTLTGFLEQAPPHIAAAAKATLEKP